MDIDELDFIEKQCFCPFCGKTKGVLIYSDLKDYYFFTPGEWSASYCKNCDHYWLSERISEKYIDQAYYNYYTHQANKSTKSSSFIGKVLARLLDDSLKIARYYISESDRILDIGCGNGDYIKLLNEHSYRNTIGIDFDPIAIQNCLDKDLNVRQSTLRELITLKYKFDVIVINHVIEHIYNPQVFINEVYELLDKNGKVLIRTPNNKSYSFLIFGRFWRGLEPPRHVHLYSRKSLDLLLSESGFSQVKNVSKNNYRLLRGSWIAFFDAYFSSKKINFKFSDSKLRLMTIPIVFLIIIISSLCINNKEEIIYIGRKE